MFTSERLHVRRDGNEDLAVEVGAPEEAPALRLHHADHAEIRATDPDLLVDGIHGPEHPVPYVGADDADVLLVLDVERK
jgi:hypothetical protein